MFSHNVVFKTELTMRATITLIICLFAQFLFAQKPRLVAPIGHSSQVNFLSVSPNGKYIASISWDKTAKIWDLQGREIQTFKDPSEGFNTVAFSQNNEWVLTTSRDRSIRLWDIKTGKERRVFREPSQNDVSGLGVAAIDTKGKLLATSTDEDSVVKVWNIETGQPVQKIGKFQTGVNALAFSPNGNQMLTGAWEGEIIREDAPCMGCPAEKRVGAGVAKLWDVKTSQLLNSFGGHQETLTALAFSNSGEYVLTGDNEGVIRLWTPKSDTPVRSFGRLGEANAGAVFHLDVSADDKYVMAVFGDGAVKFWELQTGKTVEFLTKANTDTRAAAFLPNCHACDGDAILLGGNDGSFRLVDFKGNLVQVFKGSSTALTALAFSTVKTDEGRSLYLGTKKGITSCDLSNIDLHVFDTISGAAHSSQIAFSPDGALHMANQNMAAEWNAMGKLLGKNELPKPSDFFGSRNLAISPPADTDPKGGKYVAITGRDNSFDLVERRTGKVIRNFKRPEETSEPAEPNAFDGAMRLDFKLERVNDLAFSPSGNYILSGDMGDNDAKLWDPAGIRKPQFLIGHTGPVQSVAFSPVGPFMLTGSNDSTAKLWDLNLNLIQTFEGHTYAVFYVSFSPDGKSVLTASGDGTAKLWNPETGKCLHTFPVDHPADFVFSPDGKYLLHLNLDNTIHFYDAQNTNLLATMAILNEKDWVITTPSGLFDASAGAMELMYFISGDEVIELEQLKERYYEPGLMAKLMGFSSGDLRDVQQFKDLQLYPLVEASINQNRLDIQLVKRNGGLGKLSFFVNGKEVAEDINSGRKESLSLDLKEFAKYYRTDTLNTLSLRAYNTDGWLKSQALSFPYTYIAARGSGQGGGVTLGNSKPRLFAIIVGTADYSGETLDLKYADQDASSIAAALNAAGQQLFGSDVQLKLLSTKSNVSAEVAGSVQSEISNKANIKAAFDAFAQQAQPTDVLVLYFSGHGITYGEAEKAQFFYLTKDIGSEDLSDPEIRNKFTISSNELTDWIKSIAAQKQVLILDACNSGKIVETLSTIGQKDLNPSQVRALDRMKDRTGMFILTGSAANMVSYEASQFGQGLLTYSLLQGMSGLALTDDKRVDVMTLFQYSRDKVPELAKSINGVQIPTLAFPVGGGSFDIGIVNEKVKIPLSQAKPVFIRNNFQDEDAFEDVLGLTDALEQYFRQQTAKGVQSKLIYVDVKEYENAFSMKGRYKVTGNEVAVRVRLYKGKSPLGDELNVNGKKDDMPGLVKQILQTVMPLAK